MFQFLNPIWLFAIAAVAIPVAIHLWNIRPGKVLKVGSISLMDAASRKSSRSFNLLDLLLLLLRCLLLISLAIILAIPLWHKQLTSNKTKGWVLMPKYNLQVSYQHFKTSIDSLTKAGYEFHYFETGFPKTDLNQVLLNPKDSLSNVNNQPVNYWNLSKQLDTTVSSTLPVYIFTPNRASYFAGAKPQVALNLHWNTYIPADSTATQLQEAWFTNTNTVRITQGTGKPAGVSYAYTTIRSDDQLNSPYHVDVTNGKATVSLRTGDQKPVDIDTTTLRIAIYTDTFPADAGYLEAALQAVNQFTQHKAAVKVYHDMGAIPANQDWIFWLSDKPVSNRLAIQSKQLFIYEHGKIENTNSWITEGGFSVASTAVPIGSFKIVQNSDPGVETIWRDGYGNAVLSMQMTADHKIYHFYSRFNPTWNDLVWSDEFPAWIYKLMVGNNATENILTDKLALDQQQLTPANFGHEHAVIAKRAGLLNLSNYCWLALALLFIAERWLANRKPTNLTTNG
ncbi:MAG: BatA domain-containing protein [Mucilaginibacter sp.]